MTIADEVRALRAELEESTTTFAARWLCSRRTVEEWEQGRRKPNAFVLDGMRKLAAKQKKSTARTR